MKLHVGCGSIWLEGYVNIDVQRPGMSLSSERSDLVESYRTTESRYYARHESLSSVDSLRRPKNHDGVCDRYGTAQRLPVDSGAADEILLRQVFEHFSLGEARAALVEFYRALAPGGVLRLDVPDHEGTVAKLMESHDPFYFRHMYGSRASEYGYHLMSYTRDGLRSLGESVGFEYIGEEPNIHFYPAFCMRFVKRPSDTPAWKYAADAFPSIPDYWRCLEVGPGRYPWRRANAYVDIDPTNLSKIRVGANTYEADVMKMPFKDKEWDWLFCSHCLEHVEDPLAAAKEISRVSKGGLVIVPHMLKEILFAFEEPTHRWWCSVVNGTLTFQKPDQRLEVLADVDVQKAMCRIFRRQSELPDARTLREWFLKNEAHFDCVVPWEGELRINVL